MSRSPQTRTVLNASLVDSSAWSDYHNLMFGVRRSVKYHTYRQRFFENVLNLSLFMALASGPALVFLATADPLDNGWIKYAPAIITSVFTGVALVARVGTKATHHCQLKIDFIRLRQDMERQRGKANDEEAVAEWTARRLGIEEGEPPINRVVDGLCHNELVQAMDIDDTTQYVRVLVWHRLVGPFTRYFDNGLRKYEEGEKKSVWV